MAGGGGESSSGKTSRALSGRKTSRVKSAGGTSGGLMLASMLDILMAILFFLLKNYSSAMSDFNVGKDIALPRSSSLTPPQAALQLVVTKSAILLDDKPIARIVNGDIAKNDLFKDNTTILPLAQALNEQKKRSLYIQNHSDTHSFNGTIVMQADKTLTFNVLKKVIYTAGVTDFVMLKLAVLKKDQG